MTLQFRPYSDFLSVVGMKASGKTTITKFYCKSLRRLIFIDPTWQVGELGYVVHFPERIVPAFKKFGKVIYQPKRMDKLTYQRAFEACLSQTNYTLGVDEIDKFARPRWYLCEEVHEIINRGRAQGIGLICNTRRPHMIHNDIRSNADHVICFKLHEERDCKYMGKWLGIDEQEIKNLPFYHSFYFNIKAAKVEKQLPIAL